MCLLGLLLPGRAQGGAWTQSEGALSVYVTSGTRMAPVSALAGTSLPEDDQSFTAGLAEYGLTPDLTLGLRLFGAWSVTDPDDVTLAVGGLARYRLWTGESGGVASVQAGVMLPAERWLGNGLGDSRPDSVPELELRALYGHGWATGWGHSFVSAEAGFRHRGEGQENELLFDATIGHRWNKWFQPLVSVFSRYPMGDSEDAQLTISPSLAYTFWPWSWSDNDKRQPITGRPKTLQIGISYDTLSPEDGLGVFVAYWMRF